MTTSEDVFAKSKIDAWDNLLTVCTSLRTAECALDIARQNFRAALDRLEWFETGTDTATK